MYLITGLKIFTRNVASILHGVRLLISMHKQTLVDNYGEPEQLGMWHLKKINVWSSCNWGFA